MEERSLSTFSMIAVGVGTIMGSGWMFSAQYTSEHAGPASMISWIIGAMLMIFIALAFAEVCTIVPVEGSTSRIPYITHGTLVSYIFAWITWISYLVLAPIEVQAVIQYLSVFYPSLVDPMNEGALTLTGLPIAVVLLMGFCIINFYSLRWLVRINNIITLFKLLIPIFIAVVFILFCFSLPALANRSIESIEFMPYGGNGVLAAVSAGGIGYSFVGFKAIVELAGSSKTPKKSIPIATIGAVLICMGIFLLLQAAYLLVASKYIHNNNWQDIVIGSEHTASSFGSFATMAEVFNKPWIMYLLYFGAIVFPLMAGLLYFNVSLQSLNAMVANGYMPKFLSKINPKFNKPVNEIGLNFIIALVMFAPFPGWKGMATFLTSLISLTYITAATSTITMRYKLPYIDRPFRLRFVHLVSTLCVFAATLVFLWSGCDVVSKVGIAITIAIIMLAVYRRFRSDKSHEIRWNFSESLWFWFYIVAVSAVSYYSDFGGIAYFDFTKSAALLLLISFITVFIAKYISLPAVVIEKRINRALLENMHV